MRRLSGFAVMMCCAAALTFGTATIAFAETGSAGAQVQQIADKDTVDMADGANTATASDAAVREDADMPDMTGDTGEENAEALRREVVDYALSFVGGRYVWGGEDPHSGADCSGFVRYVLSNTAGVSMSRSSYDQAREGATVSPEEMQPGDLLFYGNGRRVNHVAMYIGDGQIVHASTKKTGIKVSRWDYRTPVRIASFIG